MVVVDHDAPGRRIDELQGAKPGRTDVRVGEPRRGVCRIDETREMTESQACRAQPCRDVGPGQGGVNQIGSDVARDPPQTRDPGAPAAGYDVDRDAFTRDLVAQPLAVEETGEAGLYTSPHQGREQVDDRALGPSRVEALDDVEDSQGTAAVKRSRTSWPCR